MNAYPRIDPSQVHATCLRRLLVAVAIGTLALALTIATAPARAAGHPAAIPGPPNGPSSAAAT